MWRYQIKKGYYSSGDGVNHSDIFSAQQLPKVFCSTWCGFIFKTKSELLPNQKIELKNKKKRATKKKKRATKKKNLTRTGPTNRR